MAKSTVKRNKGIKSAAAVRADTVKSKPAVVLDEFAMAELADYLANRAVSELSIVEVTKGTYQLEGMLSWKPTRCVLVVARGGVRRFRSVDTLVRFCKEIGVGKTSIRLELKP
jgi:hypothetical protein